MIERRGWRFGALILFAAVGLLAPRAVAQVERPGVPEPAAEPNVTFTFHDEIVFEADMGPPSGMTQPKHMLIEYLEIHGAKRNEGWSDFVITFTKNTMHAWLDGIPASARDKKGKVIVVFALHRDGSLDGALSLAHSSGDASIDDATRIAIAKAAPFAPLPQQFAKAVAQLRVTFAYDHPRASAANPGASQ